MTVGIDGHAAIEVGPKDPGPDRRQSAERLSGGVPVRVADARTDDRDAGPEGRQEGFCRRGPAAVMGDLEQVQAAAVCDARRKELGVDRLFDVAREEQAASSKAYVQHGRHVVDPGARIRGLWGHAATLRPQQLERGVVQAQDVAGGEAAPIEGQPIERLVEGGVSGTRTAHPDLGHGVYPVPLEEEREPSHVVLVWMGQHEQVDPPVPTGQLRVECHEKAVGIRSAIDEHPAPSIALDEDGVALSDVEHGHAQAPIRPGAGRERRADDDHGQGRQPDPPVPRGFA
jgi:hypothetical protein